MSKDYNGVINLYKEPGMTSHSAVSKVRRLLNKVKAGHTGTLDPAAEGVLPVVIGRGTKLSDFIMDGDKVYRGKLVLGMETDTQDTSGTIIATCDKFPTEAEVLQVIKSYEKEYYQLPPMYSAIKVNGKKLYELAREGIEVQREKRLVKIFSIELVEKINEREYILDVNCSKGTYIRALFNDIGTELRCGGVMDTLIRLRTGDFSVENSVTLKELEKLVDSNEENKAIISMEKILKEYPIVTCSSKANKFLYNGNKVNKRFLSCNAFKNIDKLGKFLVFDEKQVLIGLYELKDDMAIPLIILYVR